MSARSPSPGLCPPDSQVRTLGKVAAVTAIDLQGVRVLVTGSTDGLGLAMAQALVAAGAAVAVNGRDATRAGAVAERLGGPAAGAHPVPFSVRDEAAVAAGVRAAADALGGLDVLVNNAGIGMRTVNPRFTTDPQPFWEVSPEGFRAVIDTNLTGYFLVARAAVSALREAPSGRIVNVSMNYATMRRQGFVPYGPSRAGAEALSLIMTADLAETGVTVNQLLPGGATATGMMPEGVSDAARARLLQPEIMGPPIVWLCSDRAAGVSGERIVAAEFGEWLAARE
jgi:NAD(P)-dependent dehydrogenase (short-subunit alcohol dehydrogenase family)